MRDTSLKAFVSATTQDLGSYRAAVKEELLTAGILPITQENFGPDYRTLEEFLKLEIAKSDIVICLVGSLFGSAPQHEKMSQRSYAQLEYDLAVQLNKPIFLFLTDENYIPDKAIQESAEENRLQKEHREYLKNAGHKWEKFSNVNNLKIKILQALTKIDHLSNLSRIFYLHLPKRPSYFAGRAREIAQLNDALLCREPSVIVVVGMGGQGKTSLVHKVLHDMQSIPFDLGFWCTAYRGGFSFDMFLDEVLSYLTENKFDKRDMPDMNMRVTQLLKLLQNQQLLLVIDGIERWLQGWNSSTHDPQYTETDIERKGVDAELDNFLLEASGLTNGSHIILTSRALPAALDQAARTSIPVREEDVEDMSLEGLDPEASTILLQKLGLKGTANQLMELAKTYSYHPLALTIVGTLLKKKYGGQVNRLHTDAPLDPRHELYRLFDEVRESLPGREYAEPFLIVASHCIENPSLKVISEGMQGMGSRSEDGEDLLEMAVILADWNLLWWNGITQTVNLHPLVKNYFAAVSDEAESKHIHEKLSLFYGDQPVRENATSMEDVRFRILAIKHSARAGDLNRAAELVFIPINEELSFFSWLGEWGHQFTGIDILGELAAKSKNELRGQFLLARAQMHQQLARAQLSLEDVEEAIAIFEKPMPSISHSAIGNLAKAVATRGNIHRETGSSKIAVLDFDKAIAILDTISNKSIDERLDFAKILVNRGAALHGSGSLSKAIFDYNRALDIWNKTARENPRWDQITLVPTLTNRGLAFLDFGKADRAIKDFEKAISICTKQQSRMSQETTRHLAHAKSMLGIALRKSGELKKAIVYANESVVSLQTHVEEGRNDYDHLLAFALISRANIYIVQQLWQKAQHDCDKSILIYKQLVTEAGSHFLVMLYHSQCTRAIARYNIGDLIGSDEDRRAWFEGYKQLIREWSSECEVRIGFLSDTLKTADYLLTTKREESISLIDGFVEEVELAFVEGEGTEFLRNYLFRAVPIIEILISKMEALGYDTIQLKEFTERAIKSD